MGNAIFLAFWAALASRGHIAVGGLMKDFLKFGMKEFLEVTFGVQTGGESWQMSSRGAGKIWRSSWLIIDFRLEHFLALAFPGITYIFWLWL